MNYEIICTFIYANFPTQVTKRRPTDTLFYNYYNTTAIGQSCSAVLYGNKVFAFCYLTIIIIRVFFLRETVNYYFFGDFSIFVYGNYFIL